MLVLLLELSNQRRGGKERHAGETRQTGGQTGTCRYSHAHAHAEDKTEKGTKAMKRP